MDIEYLHLYVEDAAVWHDWFVTTLNFRSVSPAAIAGLGERAVQSARIRILISSAETCDTARQFLGNHAEGVGDVAFRVSDLDAIAAQLRRVGGVFTQPIQLQQTSTGAFRWCRIKGWGSLNHTLIEHPAPNRASAFALPPRMEPPLTVGSSLPWLTIDHAVLNVPLGQLEAAAAWYEAYLGFERRQQFVIETPRSGLRSLVLKHPAGEATLPINEPTSANSQIQEFLDLHQGAGIQHVALQTRNLVQTVATLRRREVSFLSVPETYYRQLPYREGFWREAGDWDAIAQQQILVDWPAAAPHTRLLQTFTQPLFEKPTFFWEFIERQTQTTEAGTLRAEGFGEGNFKALFEAIEREQQQRGSLG